MDREEETPASALGVIDELRERLAATEARLDELVGRLGGLHPDDLGRVQALAEDGLARAGNAQSTAEDVLDRLVEAESKAVDALARADNARAAAEEAHARVVGAEAHGVDALERAGNAQQIAEDALARFARVEALGGDALARADNAQRLADKAMRRATAAQGHGEDALATTRQARDQADDALQRAGSAGARAEDAEATARFALDSAREALLPARMAAFSAWLELRPPSDGPLISVVLPTRDRPALLPRAINSLLGQLYERWEAIVVDDGDTDAVATVLANAEDERVVVVDGPRRGLGAARNAGLDVAAGEVVCYLDDDNVMHPRWLQAVAHVFAGREDVDVAYGVTLAEHRVADTLEHSGWWPSFWQLPWSRADLLEQNLTDAGALAHRRELSEARFGEAMGEDWDLLIRLTDERPALAVPAVSHAYAMGGGDHMSRTADHAAALEQVRRRHADA